MARCPPHPSLESGHVNDYYCIRPRQATGQTAAITPSRMPKSDSWRCTAWSV